MRQEFGSASVRSLDIKAESVDLSARSMMARALIGAVLAILAGFDPAAVLSAAGAGIVVEEATAGFAGEKAGVAPGDVILGWSRAANPPTNAESAEGQIETPFDLLDVEIEQAPRGGLTLIGRRGEADMRWIMPPDEWRVLAHPPLSAGILQPYQEGKRRIEAHKLEDGVGFWESAATMAANHQDWRLAGWLLLRAADVLGHDREQRRTDEFFARALELLDEERFPIENAFALQSWGDSLVSRGLPHLAKERYERALRLLDRTRPESLAVARAWYGLGRAESRGGNDSEAETRHRQALMLREKLAPHSTATADSLSALGMHASVLKDLAVAEEYLARALSIREGAMGLAQALDRSALAGVAAQRGDYMTAAERLNPALSVVERLAPSSHELAYSLYMAGLINSHIGDLERAESYTRRALHIYRVLSGNDRRAGLSLRLLSSISWRRRDFALAESLGKEALAIFELAAPRTEQVGAILHHLGDIALDRGDLAAAEEYFRRALAIGQEHVPEGLIIASHLRCLGLTLARSGRLGEGEQHAARSAEIRRRLVPNSNELSKSLMALAEIARLQGHLALAQERYEEALAIRSRVVPGSWDEAEAHHGLGWVHRAAGRRAKAAESFQRAIDALEHQRGKLGGTHEAVGGFTAAYGRYYQDAMENLVALGRSDEAFYVLERSRARLLLAMLAERDLMFRADLPRALARERQLNQASYDRAQAELAQLSPHKDGPEIDRLLGRLRELRAEGAEISSRVRAASPRLASLQHPQPLNARATAIALDPGTSLLVFAVGEHTTLLFALRAQEVSQQDGGLSVFTLPIGRRALRERIESFRRLIASANPDQKILKARAAELYNILLRPADAILASSDHVAISPDGPLHVLPFAALVRTDTAGTHTVRRWVAEWRAVSIVASATHYAELKKIRHTDGASDGGLVAFGDPSHSPAAAAPPDSISDVELRRAPEGGSDLGRCRLLAVRSRRSPLCSASGRSPTSVPTPLRPGPKRR